MQDKIEYLVREDTAVEVVSSDPIDLQTVPAWTITRATGGMGWHIGKYRTPEAAHAVAAVLKAFTGDEIV
ncbi:hypothetical protein SEA_MARKY_40 [Streptomyces phage Marky]|nr:hypothetical protein SEA_MARKY_40 [Streptomyces phage Marky]